MPPAIELEWKTFVAETYRRAAARSLAVLTALPPMERDVAARTLVEGSLDLFDARLDDPAAPWPSRRIPASLVPPDIAAGHDAVLAAELAFRSRHAESSSTAQAHR